MTEPHRTFDQQQHVESHAPYMKVFFALLVFTILEYFYAKLAADRMSFALLVLGLMAMAVTKATLVGMYFMHLKFEGRWVYLMLVPASILAAVLILALYPDIGLQRGAEPDDEATEAITASLLPQRGGSPQRPKEREEILGMKL